jgi:hypothetical protein
MWRFYCVDSADLNPVTDNSVRLELNLSGDGKACRSIRIAISFWSVGDLIAAALSNENGSH